MNLSEFTVRYSRGVRFPNTPAVLAMKDVVKRLYGTTSPAILAIKLRPLKRKR